MTSVLTTYRIEERLAAAQEADLEPWRSPATTSREQAVAAFDLIVRAEERHSRLYGPRTGNRLVLLAEPASGAPLHPEADDELAEALRAYVDLRAEVGQIVPGGGVR